MNLTELDPDAELTTTQAARLTGLSRDTIYGLCHDDVIGVKWGARWVILAAELTEYFEARGIALDRAREAKWAARAREQRKPWVA